MEYLSLLHLDKEPFSNSPDPDFFFDSHQHLECLQKLELTIRLRQGLSVVLGDVGTGKTTLCRQLIRRLHQGTDLSLVRLLLDPEFGSPKEFLLALINEFGLNSPPADAPDRVLKETIKNFLIEEGAENKKIIVLLIDEGQKLPGFCLEIIRELLNFETNNHKLLQTVIFAQKELEEELKTRSNFTDRIATFFSLTPFNYRDTRKMIQHRLSLAGRDGKVASTLFTGPAFWVIYRVSKGYPRKIVQLCAKSLLSLIIQNKSRVSASLARACAQRMAFNQYGHGRMKYVVWGTVAISCVCGFLWFLSNDIMPFQKLDVIHSAQPEQSRFEQPSIISTEIPTEVKQEIVDISSIAPAAGLPAKNNNWGTLLIHEGETLNILLQRIYGRYSPALLEHVLKENPHIKNPNIVQAGTSIHFPAMNFSSHFSKSEYFSVQVGEFSSLKEMNSFLSALPSGGPNLFPVAIEDSDTNWSFLVCLNEQFTSQTDAGERIASLSPLLQTRSQITHNLDIMTKIEKGHDS